MNKTNIIMTQVTFHSAAGRLAAESRLAAGRRNNFLSLKKQPSFRLVSSAASLSGDAGERPPQQARRPDPHQPTWVRLFVGHADASQRGLAAERARDSLPLGGGGRIVSALISWPAGHKTHEQTIDGLAEPSWTRPAGRARKWPLHDNKQAHLCSSVRLLVRLERPLSACCRKKAAPSLCGLSGSLVGASAALAGDEEDH